jgi:hypothetical protein
MAPISPIVPDQAQPSDSPECLIFAAKKPHEVPATSDGGFTGGNTVPHKIRRDK